ncbi:DUF2254 domain-containing protein [Lentisalinibacter orientalis]|uniref:DUF2254 domain-containing protein n=1 Tax=Lentisalinibacter orientalis TaxID=2992241 RepID=UPI00386B0639
MNDGRFPWARMSFWLRRTLRQLWVRVAGFAILAIASAVLARLLSPLVPAQLAPRLGAESVGQILTILASSMLAVTTFSLSIAVSAFAAAASTATPRATALLQQDNTTQNVLATFLGAFLFSLLGLIGLQADLYSDSGQVILFFFSVLVVTLVVVALIHWIGHLADFGRMNDTLDRVEAAATASFERRVERPCLGANPMPDAIPAHTMAIHADEIGYVQHIDVQALEECAVDLDTLIYVTALPGSFVHPGAPLLRLPTTGVDAENAERLRAVFSLGSDRTFEEDPRFGLIVLSEIASRALSPAVNDPGTAISVIGRLVRILALWRPADDIDVLYPHVFVPPITPQEVLEDAFRPIARDGAMLIEVQLRLQAAFRALQQTVHPVFGDTLEAASRAALERSAAAGLRPGELDALERAAIAVNAHE